MPRSLVSFWKRVATSGATVDGRVILPQELRDIAETYKPSFYTAVIWCDHERWPGSHGTVYAVRLVEEAEDLEPGEIALEAQLKPNDRLLYLNDQGQKLFTSIEISPDFRNSGRAYLTGMGVTDEPASVGTQELYFSHKNSRTSYYAASVEVGRLRDESPNTSETGLINALTSFFKRFATEALPPEITQPQTESKPPMDEATATALTALVAQLLVVAAGLQAVIEPAAEDAPAPDQDLIDDVGAAVDEIVTTAEEEREFRRKGKGNQSVLAKLDALQKQFTTLQNTSAGRQLPRNPGPVTAPRRKVL